MFVICTVDHKAIQHIACCLQPASETKSRRFIHWSNSNFENVSVTGNVYRILYEEIDESEVKIYNFPSTNTNGMGDIEQYR